MEKLMGRCHTCFISTSNRSGKPAGKKKHFSSEKQNMNLWILHIFLMLNKIKTSKRRQAHIEVDKIPWTGLYA